MYRPIEPSTANATDMTRRFYGALMAMEDSLNRMKTMAEQAGEGWRREFVELRRQLQSQLDEVGTTAQACKEFHALPDLMAEFRRRFSKLRSSIALHQANNPAVSIDPKDPKYWESSNTISEAAISFGRIARKMLNESRR